MFSLFTIGLVVTGIVLLLLIWRVVEYNKELRLSKRRYEELIDTVEGVVWESNKGVSPYTLVNKHAEKMLGYPLKRWLSESGFWQRIVHPEDRTRLPVVEKRDSEDHFSSEYRVFHADGRVVWVKDIVNMVDASCGSKKLRGVMFDITDKKDFEAALIKAREEALKAADIKTAFLANMSHEIRTPLNAVIGMSTIALDTKLTRTQRSYIKTIKRSADTLLMLINDILDFSKIEAGKLNLEISNFELKELISNAFDIVRPNAKKKDIRLIKEVPKNIPTVFSGDSGRILQILMNLLSNAVKFTESGQVILRVKLKEASEGQGPRLRFAVIDTGIGIPESVCRKLFMPFSQGDDSNARKFGGTGLGLSICKGLVELMKGEIGVQSIDSKGSKFWFEIPIGIPDLSREGVREINKSKPFSFRLHKPLRILLAEDNTANQKVMRLFIEKLGHKVDVVANGLEAIAATENRKYDIIIMDCQMPELDGYEATQRIRQKEKLLQKPRTPILALTAHALSGNKEVCLKSGMDDYLTKPVDLSKLSLALQKWAPIEGAPQVFPLRRSKEEMTAIIDENYIQNLSTLVVPGKPDPVLEVIHIFNTTCPKTLKSLEEAMSKKDFQKIMREAHHLKSTCYSIGALRMAKIASQIEEAAEKKLPFKRIAQAIAQLKREKSLAQRKIKSLLRIQRGETRHAA